MGSPKKPIKVYVPVDLAVDKNGQMYPRTITWEDGRKYEIDRVLEMTNLTDIRHKKVGSFSGGMKQRVMLAQALLGEPKVLILDEPTAGLDPRERARLRDHIYRLAQDRIVLLATHIVSDIEAIAKDILLLKQGQLLRSGTAGELIDSLPSDWIPVLHAPSLEDVYLYYLGEDDHE